VPNEYECGRFPRVSGATMRECGWRVWVVVVALAAAGGCALKKPYSADPLLRHGHGEWGEQVQARTADRPTAPEPTAPLPPADSPRPLVAVILP